MGMLAEVAETVHRFVGGRSFYPRMYDKRSVRVRSRLGEPFLVTTFKTEPKGKAWHYRVDADGEEFIAGSGQAGAGATRAEALRVGRAVAHRA